LAPELRRLGAGTFGRRRLCERNPWRRTVIKFNCYFRKSIIFINPTSI